MRSAAAGDAAAVRELLDVPGDPVGEDRIRALLDTAFRDPRHAVVVAELDAEVVGLLVMVARPSLYRGGWVGSLEALVVRPDRRRRGVGEALLQYAKGLAAERQFVRLEVEVAHVHAIEAGPFLLDLGLEPGGVETFCWGALEHEHPRVPGAAGPLTPAVV